MPMLLTVDRLGVDVEPRKTADEISRHSDGARVCARILIHKLIHHSHRNACNEIEADDAKANGEVKAHAGNDASCEHIYDAREYVGSDESYICERTAEAPDLTVNSEQNAQSINDNACGEKFKAPRRQRSVCPSE